jgi:formylglycine-generating enzyme
VVNTVADGFAGLAPVGCFAPNPFGLYDMIGNVWEMTGEDYGPTRPGEPPAPSRHVIKGGSFLCAANYCQRYRPAARQGQDSSLGSSNVGFRLVYDAVPARPR